MGMCSAMKRHVGSVTVQDHGCVGLRHLIEIPGIVQTIIAAGGFDIVSSAMSVNATARSVQLEASALLERVISMCGSDTIVMSAARESGVLECVCAAAVSIQDAVLQGHCFAVLETMAR